jgi:Tol biopolymer transport system component
MDTGVVMIFDGGENKMNFAPCFSWDGKRIAYIGAREQGYARNLFVMNADGSGRRQVSRNPATGLEDTVYVLVPSFAPDGKRIIFLRSQRVRERAFPLKGEMNCDWDVYEADVDTGVERRLTNYRFYKALSPHYLADGKRFIFTGEGPYNPHGPGPRNYKEYEDLYGENFIFIMDGVKNELKPAVVNGRHSQCASVDRKDTLLFRSRTTEMDGLPPGRDTQDLFLFKNGRVERLTRLNAYIDWSLLSRDGSTVLFSKQSDRKSREFSYWMMKSDGTGLKEIVLPAELLKR